MSTIKSVITSTLQTAAELLAPKKTPPPAAPGAAKKTPPAASEIATVALLAWQAPTVNRTLLVAYKPNTDPTNPNNLVSVRVRSNHNFIRNMKVRARHVEGTTYDLVGPLPRWRGRY